MEIKGIDVSKWQGKTDWQKAKNDGVEFAIIREGYGKKSPTQIDKKFTENYKSAKAANVPLGCYHYSYADCVNDAILEAQFCLENIQGMQFEYPICFDIEDKEMLKLSTRERTDICKAFCDEIEKNGYYAMIYCNLDWLNNYLYKDELINKYDLWLAQWNCGKPSVSCGIWQYSSTGFIDGISGNVDLNITYKNYPEIMKQKGLNGFVKESSTTPKETKNYISYTVTHGESLWGIADKMLGNGARYKEIKDLSNLSGDMIYPGQILKIPVTKTQELGNYTVQKSDTLWNIAEKYYGNGNKYIELKNKNNLLNDTIYPGQILKL